MLKYGTLLALIIIIIANAIFTKNFFSIGTLWNLLFQCTDVVILAMGMTMVIAAGGIDISVGSMMACTSMIAAQVMNLWPDSVIFGIFAPLVFAFMFGGVIGLLISRYRMQPMIVTLSMLYTFRGIGQILHNGGTLSVPLTYFTDFAYIKVWGVVPVQFFVWLFIIAIVYILVRKTRFGIYIEAFGDNAVATKISGVNIVLVVVIAHALCSLFAGLAGLMETSLATSSDPNTLGLNMELDAIAAVAIGGTPMNGGRPNMLGSILGAFIITLITIIVNMNNIPYAWSLILKTIVLVAALYMQNIRNAKSLKMGGLSA
jgi:ribose transport system permease protein